jgi:hypothetical protein
LALGAGLKAAGVFLKSTMAFSIDLILSCAAFSPSKIDIIAG